MTVSSITSASIYAQWQMSCQRSASATGASTAAGGGDTDDSVQISQQGFAALLQTTQTASPSQGAGGADLTDDRAAQIGSHIQSRDPALFTQMDADGNGSLSAQELIDGRDKLRAAHAASIGQQIDQANPALFTALDANGDGTLSTDELKAGRDLLSGVSAGGVGGAAGANGPDPIGGQAARAHRHHHHGMGGEPPADDGVTDASSANADPFAGLDPVNAGTADLQANTLNDIFQQLFASLGSSSTGGQAL